MIAKEPRPGPPMSGSNKSGGISEALMTATATRFVLCNAPLFSVFYYLGSSPNCCATDGSITTRNIKAPAGAKASARLMPKKAFRPLPSTIQ